MKLNQEFSLLALVIAVMIYAPIMTSCGNDEPSNGTSNQTDGSKGNDGTTVVTSTYSVNGVQFKMVEVEGGKFSMGRWVTLSSYSIGQTEVTQELWQAVMHSNPSYFQSSTDTIYGTNLKRPVENVSWDDCQEFITKLNQMTGKNFRLPTEAEWQFAAQGGNHSLGYKYAGSNTLVDVAWCYDNIPSHEFQSAGFGPQTVATKSPNELGLYDMSGNVFEWCWDWYKEFPRFNSDPVTNPIGASSGKERVLRGGSWNQPVRPEGERYIDFFCVDRRYKKAPSYAMFHIGLRLAHGAASSLNESNITNQTN